MGDYIEHLCENEILRYCSLEYWKKSLVYGEFPRWERIGDRWRLCYEDGGSLVFDIDRKYKGVFEYMGMESLPMDFQSYLLCVYNLYRGQYGEILSLPSSGECKEEERNGGYVNYHEGRISFSFIPGIKGEGVTLLESAIDFYDKALERWRGENFKYLNDLPLDRDVLCYYDVDGSLALDVTSPYELYRLPLFPYMRFNKGYESFIGRGGYIGDIEVAEGIYRVYYKLGSKFVGLPVNESYGMIDLREQEKLKFPDNIKLII